MGRLCYSYKSICFKIGDLYFGFGFFIIWLFEFGKLFSFWVLFERLEELILKVFFLLYIFMKLGIILFFYVNILYRVNN